MQNNVKMSQYFMGLNNFYGGYGVVEDRNDPKKLGRVRVRVIGIHTDNKNEGEGIPTEHLPWATPAMPVLGPSMNGIGYSPTGLIEGTWCMVVFRDGEDLQDPMIIATFNGIPEEVSNPEFGFNDPQKNQGVQPPLVLTQKDDGSGNIVEEDEYTGYPKEKFLNEPDVNRLARNEKIDETIVEQKKTNTNIGQTDILTAEGYAMGELVSDKKNFTEPKTPYNAEYPYNHVYESESGHIFEIDDTKGSERLHKYHRVGTFEEIHPDGTQVEKIVGDNYQIVLKNNNIHIEGFANLTIDKGSKILVNKDQEGNNLDLEVSENGDLNITVKKGDLNVNVLDGNFTKFVDGDVKEHITGDWTRLIEGDKSEIVQGKYVKNIEDNVKWVTKGLTAITREGQVIEKNDADVVRTYGGNHLNNVALSDITYAKGFIGRFSPFVLINF